MHYRDGKSEIDDNKFFFSPNGKTDPLDELKETIKSFLNSKETGNNHPICRFPARFYFLNSYLNLSNKIKVKPECRDLNSFLKELQPYSISIVFSDYYMNSPASMYGHTFLRIDPPISKPLLGYAINFAANADTNEGLMYYIKGLTGGYKGFYSIFPYYKKIFEYNNLESRNLWEYRLNIPPEKVKFIALHVYELKNHYSYYYFFDKNCSYQILYLIQLAFPDKKIVQKFNHWTIPVETIRMLKDNKIISNLKFRPSATTLITQFINNNPDISEKDIQTAVKIARFEINPETFLTMDIPNEKKGKILELSKLLFIYYAIKERMPYKEYRRKFLKLLSVRSKTGYITRYKIDMPPPPHQGHKPGKFQISTGSDYGKKFIAFSIRTSYHQIEDNDTGFLKGSEVLFPTIKLLHYPDQNKTVIDKLTFVKITSLAPKNIIFKPVSWFVDFSVKRDWTENKKDSFLHLDFGMGHTYQYKNFILFGGFDTGVQGNINYVSSSRLFTGLKFLSIFSGEKTKHIFLFSPNIFLTKDSTESRLDLRYSFSLFLSTNSALGIDSQLTNFFDKNFYAITFSVKRYL